ncbi:hypothetical protein GCM10029964_059090 [Kibdelosporangium lantanae]
MTVRFAHNGDIHIAYETFAPAVDPRRGDPMLGWLVEFCEALVERGFHVARCDNRDAGRSSRAGRPYVSSAPW